MSFVLFEFSQKCVVGGTFLKGPFGDQDYVTARSAT